MPHAYNNKTTKKKPVPFWPHNNSAFFLLSVSYRGLIVTVLKYRDFGGCRPLPCLSQHVYFVIMFQLDT
ncbi:hypothetical protein BX600DRAFT_183830 [Xylariales sp. PMI_506]|nr:hypothetical protein BX600DRAFT_183830 [Xylariales sp. PMI_506]